MTIREASGDRFERRHFRIFDDDMKEVPVGTNVFSTEVEAAIIDHPKVADVVVVGLRDEEWARRVHAIVAPTDPGYPPTFDEVKAYVKSELLVCEVPKSLGVVDAIPRSEAMKVNRGRLGE